MLKFIADNTVILRSLVKLREKPDKGSNNIRGPGKGYGIIIRYKDIRQTRPVHFKKGFFKCFPGNVFKKINALGFCTISDMAGTLNQIKILEVAKLDAG
ncbi:MAG: hypothetical protein SCH71_06505 [Desulfobulbaceae bacterium]|nr:hypothetical protein [Desulfobulbaceae bacterium]